jgi:hypothetical protein
VRYWAGVQRCAATSGGADKTDLGSEVEPTLQVTPPP